MYQLLISGAGWPPRRGTLGVDRLLEHTETAIKQRFTQDGLVSAPLLAGLPSVFAQESSRKTNHVASLGVVTSARFVEVGRGREIHFEYAIDPGMPTVTNSTLESLHHDLGIDSYEFTRTHWAVKDVDLYQVLFRHGGANVLVPTVFHFDGDVDENRVSVMMPFDASFSEVYATLVETAKSLRMSCNRADDIWKHDAIIQDVVTLIRTSKVVVCDLSGKNPNVFYETGIAHALGSRVILIAQHEGDVPFDLRHLRYIRYHNNAEGRAELAEKVKARLETLAAE